jgi:hypothetical protein
VRVGPAALVATRVAYQISIFRIHAE